MTEHGQHDVKAFVRDRYARIAEGRQGSCGGGGGACCGGTEATAGGTDAQTLGYAVSDLATVPDGADLGLGCGNPHAIASLQPGETVLDLGSGAGMDCFLAARRVGPAGCVIGVDMTPEMLVKARQNARTGDFSNTEFRLGEIEHLPVADASVDVIISNCVINLSPDKPQVFREAFRALKPGGRLAVSDVVATAALPEEVKSDLALYTGCVAGAMSVAEVTATLVAAGFEDVRVDPKASSREFIRDWAPGRSVADYVVSADITARKPG